MRIAHGTVVAGKVVLDEPSLPDGADVYVLAREPGAPVHIHADELAELEAGLAEPDRSDTVSGGEFFQQLGRHG